MIAFHQRRELGQKPLLALWKRKRLRDRAIMGKLEGHRQGSLLNSVTILQGLGFFLFFLFFLLLVFLLCLFCFCFF